MRRNTALDDALISQFLHFSRLIAIGDMRRGRSIPTLQRGFARKSQSWFSGKLRTFGAEWKHYMIHRRSQCANVSVSAQADRVQGVLQKRDNEYAPWILPVQALYRYLLLIAFWKCRGRYKSRPIWPVAPCKASPILLPPLGSITLTVGRRALWRGQYVGESQLGWLLIY